VNDASSARAGRRELRGGRSQERPETKKNCARNVACERRLGRKGAAAACAEGREPSRQGTGNTLIFMSLIALPPLRAATGLTTMESHARQLGENKIKGS